MPKIKFECVEDLYTLYCMVYGVESEIFWHEPISTVERVFENILAFRGWENSPRER